jgi:hypothetical protein
MGGVTLDLEHTATGTALVLVLGSGGGGGGEGGGGGGGENPGGALRLRNLPQLRIDLPRRAAQEGTCGIIAKFSKRKRKLKVTLGY